MTKVFFRTFGCALNISDTEVMQGCLAEQGYDIVDDPDDSEVIVINTCAVKKPAEKKFFRYLDEAKSMRRPVVVAGCIAQALPEKLKGFCLLGPGNLGRIAEAIEETMHGNPVVMLEKADSPRLGLPKVRKNRIIEIIPICRGCLGECTYCIVSQARGEFKSYPKEDIIHQAEMAVAKGAKELWLTAQDTGCYGMDIGSSLPELLEAVAKIEGEFFIRVGMMNPDHAMAMMDRLIPAFRDEKVFSFLHVPVQSGNDRILGKMGRRYSAADFRELVQRVRKEIPDMTIATDMICGFPGETDEEFADSLRLVEELRPDIINISRFGSRPRTRAAKMFPLSGRIIKERSRKLTSVFVWNAFETNKRWRGWEGQIIIDEAGKDRSWVGRNHSYKPVIVEGDYSLGRVMDVRIENITAFDLRGREV